MRVGRRLSALLLTTAVNAGVNVKSRKTGTDVSAGNSDMYTAGYTVDTDNTNIYGDGNYSTVMCNSF